MVILILTKNKRLYDKLTLLVTQLGESKVTVIGTACADEASHLIIKHNPGAILIDTEAKGLKPFEFIQAFPPSLLRHYALVPKRKSIAIKAIRHGVNGMFDLENDMDDFAEWLTEKCNLYDSKTNRKFTSN